jgi:hypothetical protein
MQLENGNAGSAAYREPIHGQSLESAADGTSAAA